jgi:hypothetical protein
VSLITPLNTLPGVFHQPGDPVVALGSIRSELSSEPDSYREGHLACEIYVGCIQTIDLPTH